ncbi:hypothetical protein IVB34_12345 [Bradyrhizobium sp. 2]|uniref:hypothetical protein n=1 Tax=Bradyrhizobium sp. 2 TaxID=190045 RepID=UPI001FF85535|nr:hypothetical protein [Bradyrhizobium sp. 2]MCK1459145.1 hypothetical protein [Bradyrhizobium sp. 2]
MKLRVIDLPMAVKPGKRIIAKLPKGRKLPALLIGIIDNSGRVFASCKRVSRTPVVGAAGSAFRSALIESPAV